MCSGGKGEERPPEVSDREGGGAVQPSSSKDDIQKMEEETNQPAGASDESNGEEVTHAGPATNAVAEDATSRDGELEEPTAEAGPTSALDEAIGPMPSEAGEEQPSETVASPRTCSHLATRTLRASNSRRG